MRLEFLSRAAGRERRDDTNMLDLRSFNVDHWLLIVLDLSDILAVHIRHLYFTYTCDIM